VAAADPALGLSGYMAQDRAQMNAGPAGSSDLARAAKSLESAQGGIAGQTMAISNLSMATQSAVMNVSSQMSALSGQIASLNMAIARLAGGMGTGMPMTSSPPPPPAYAAASYQGPNMASAASFAGSSGMSAVRGMGTFGTGLGFMAGALTAPLAGSVPVSRTPYGAEMSPGAGMYQSAVLGSGLGIDRQTLRGMHYDRARSAGRERFGDAFSSGMGALGGAAATYGLSEAGAFVGGRMIMPALGYSGSGLVGGIAGSVIGGAVLAPATMALSETMKQTGQIREHGNQFGRNAYAMGMGRPRREERGVYGRAANNLSIEDLTMTSEDVTQVSAGMLSGDLTRGVRNANDAGERLRQLSSSVKQMARALGGSYAEMTQVVGELQAIGVTSSPENTRRAVFGASSVFGMTGKQGMAAGMAGAQPFVGMGLGSQGLGIGFMGANIGQSAIQSGTLDAATVAAVGGREGVNALTSKGLASFLQGPAGMAMLAGGMNAGGGFGMGNLSGLGVQGMLGRGGSMASGGNLLEMAMRPQELQRQAAENPTALLAAAAAMANDIGRQVAPPGADAETAFMAGLQAVMPGLQGPELEAMAKMIKESPDANMRQARAMSSEASSQVTSDIMENASLLGRAGRFLKRPIEKYGSDPLSRSMDFYGTQAEGALEGLSESWRERVYGISARAVHGGGSAGSVSELISSASGAGRRGMGVGEGLRRDEEMFGAGHSLVRERRLQVESRKVVSDRGTRQVPERARRAAEDYVYDNLTSGNQEKINKLKARIMNETDPDTKARLAREILDIATNGNPLTGVAAQAIEDVVSQRVGLNLTDMMLGGVADGRKTAVSESDEKEYDNALGKLRRATNWRMSKSEIETLIGDESVREYLQASADPSTGKKKLLEMREKMSGDKRRLVEAISSQDQDSIGAVNRVAGLRADEIRARSAGKGISDALVSAGLGSMAAGLGESAGIGDLVDALGRDFGVDEDQLKKMKAAGVDDSVISSLMLKASDEVSASQMKALENLVGKDQAAAMAEGGLTEEEVAQARIMAQGSIAGRISTSADMSGNQMSMIVQASKAYSDLAKHTVDLARIVDEIKKK